MSEIKPVENLLVRIRDFGVNEPNHWSPSMCKYYNTIQTISRVDDLSRQIFLYGNGYYWYKYDFVKVNSNG
jgi:hypothetical protein